MNRKQGGTAKSAHAIDHTVASDRARNGIGSQGTNRPKLVTGGEVIAAHFGTCVDDHLGASALLKNQRSRPGRLLVVGLAPKLLASVLVESHNEIFALVIPIDDKIFAEQGRRTAFAK